MNWKLTTPLCFSMFCGLTASSAAALQIEITPVVSGENLQPASLRYQTSAGERFSITRVSYLVSNFALQRDDGSWLEISNSVAWLDFDRDRNSIWLDRIPAGEFRTVRFTIGLNTNLNHADAASFPAGHPLNPNLDGLHWGWQGGYVFLALEGLWRNSAGELDGWAYHLARDPNATRITLAVPLAVTKGLPGALVKKFDLVFNIRGASVSEEMGLVAVEFEGTSEQIERAIEWMRQTGLTVEPIEKNVIE